MSSGIVIRTRGAGNRGVGGVVSALFFIVFLAMGLFFEGLIVRDFVQNVGTYSWTETPCEIVSSGIKPARGDYAFEVEYRYAVNDRPRTSRQYSLKGAPFSDYADAQQLALRFPAGMSAVCYVNPAPPRDAILVRPSLWMGFWMLFPLIFVGIGGGGLFWSVRGVIRGLRKAGPDAPAMDTPISDQASGAQGRRFGYLFCGFFALIGGVALFFTCLRPTAEIIAACHWLETPCTVVSSEVKSYSGNHGSTYSVNILYAYEVGGHEYRANRYHFMGGSSSGYAGKAVVVRRYPPGQKAVCFVNPRDPTDAVLERGFTAGMLFGLIPLVFLLIGVGGLVFMVRSGRGGTPALSESASVRLSRLHSSAAPSSQPAVWDEADAASKVLKPQFSPVGKLLGAILMAAFWNGIVSVFVVNVIQGWRRHSGEWFQTIFMIPFVAVGLGLIGYVFYSLLALFNPRPRLTVTPGAVPLGEAVEVKWELTGRADRIRHLRLHLEGREEATYQRGTNTATDRSVFAKVELANITDRLAIRGGQARVVLPAGLMHSWTAGHNKIIWSLHIRGDIPWWPDLKEEFPLTVLPRKTLPTKTP